MKKTLIFTLLAAPLFAQANDTTGFVSTGGIEYIKNDKIAMQREELFISQAKIKVNYQYKNLTDQDVSETVLFPLPIVMNQSGGDFADTKGLIDSFKVWVNDEKVKPEAYVRAFLYEVKDGEQYELIPHDVTEAFKKCGISDEEMQDPWTQKFEGEVEQEILKCNDPALAKFNLPRDGTEEFLWGSQIVYSWQQVFKANEITRVNHEYQPLLGGSVSLASMLEYEVNNAFHQAYCLDGDFKKSLAKIKNEIGTPYRELGYILKTGANWAKPIEDFTLTVERNKADLVSFCWHGGGKVTKLKEDDKTVQFQVKEKNFTPKQDLNVLFVNKFEQ